MTKLFIICGLSFAGKSTLGNAIAARLDCAKVDIDDTKFDLYGRDAQDDALARADWERIYAETYRRIEEHLASGRTVVHDSGNFSKAERLVAHEIAARQGATVVTIYVDTPQEITRRRLHANREVNTRLDVSDKDFEEAVQAMEPPAADEQPLVFHYGDDRDRWISEYVATAL